MDYCLRIDIFLYVCQLKFEIGREVSYSLEKNGTSNPGTMTLVFGKLMIWTHTQVQYGRNRMAAFQMDRVGSSLSIRHILQLTCYGPCSHESFLPELRWKCFSLPHDNMSKKLPSHNFHF